MFACSPQESVFVDSSSSNSSVVVQESGLFSSAAALSTRPPSHCYRSLVVCGDTSWIFSPRNVPLLHVVLSVVVVVYVIVCFFCGELLQHAQACQSTR